MTALRKTDLKPHERRRHSRVAVALEGRFMLENKQEYTCRTVNLSPGGVLLETPVVGQMMEKVVAYLDHIGRVEGVIVRTVENGFAVKLTLAASKRDRVADLLTWLANRQAVGIAEDRRHERIVPRQPETSLQLASGACLPARIIDISMSGVGISVKARPSLHARVVVGRTPGKVVRHFQEGIAVEFLRLIPSERFDEDILL